VIILVEFLYIFAALVLFYNAGLFIGDRSIFQLTNRQLGRPIGWTVMLLILQSFSQGKQRPV